MQAECSQIDFRNRTVTFSANNKLTCDNGILQIFASGLPYFKDNSKDYKDCDEESLILAHFRKYGNLLSSTLLSFQSITDVANILNELSGPWSLIYFQPGSDVVIVGRDPFGRKSLLWSLQDDILKLSPFVSTSGSPLQEWKDVPPGVVTMIYLKKESLQRVAKFCTLFINDGAWFDIFGVVSVVNDAVNLLQFTLNPDIFCAEVQWMTVTDYFLRQFKSAVQRTLFDVDEITQAVCVPFSGGVDSLLVAYTVLDYLPTTVAVDLVNVAFSSDKNYAAAPDRIQSIKAFRFLKTKNSHRSLRLILVDVTLLELQQCRREYIALATAPSCSVLDDSIACVQWFAARAQGILYDETSPESFIPIRSKANIVIVGTGADELFGGYMRHKTIYEKHGRGAVLTELQTELETIGGKNLGRDDRIVSSLKKDLRAPFLDNIFIGYVVKLPLEFKFDFTMLRGRGEKKLLREALKAVGAPEELFAAPKRAMQFGSRIAKLEKRNEKGSDICPRLISVIDDIHRRTMQK